jgi:hypothetical protein
MGYNEEMMPKNVTDSSKTPTRTYVCSARNTASVTAPEMGLIFLESVNHMETNEQLPPTGIVSILISSKPLNDHGGIDIGIYLIAL